MTVDHGISPYGHLWPPCRSTGGCEALYGGGVICMWCTFAPRETAYLQAERVREILIEKMTYSIDENYK